MGPVQDRGAGAGAPVASTRPSALAAVLPTRLVRVGAPVAARDQLVVGPRLALAPSVAAALAPPVLAAADDASGAPLSSSRSGSLFVDGGDPAVSWYLPAYALLGPDPVFAFAAVQDGADAQGRPFNRCTITVGLRSSIPTDVQSAMQADPSRTFRPIPVVSLDASLALRSRADDGSEVVTAVPGTVVATGADTLTATFDALLGPTVLLAFSALTATASAEVDLRASYSCVSWRFVVDPVVDDGPPERFPTTRVPLDQVVVRRPSALGQLRVVPRAAQAVDDARLRLPWRRGPVLGDGRRRLAVHDVAVEPYALPLGLTYGGPSYRPAFTLTARGQSHGIVSAQDLEEFDVHQSEYVELTSFGSVANRYPTLRALYLGQVSGTVLAIPAAYGVLRDQDGCAIRCDAVVDTAPTSASGCRFALTFTVAPLVDPGDLARLTADLAADPSLAGRQSRLALPSDLDRRTAGTLSSPVVTDVDYGVGLVPDTFTVSVAIVDDDVPAVVKANLVLAQLTAAPASLLGRVAVRLDDAYDQTVSCDVVLNLRHTTGSTDVALVVDTESDAVSLVNQSDLDLVVHEVTSHAAAGFTSSVLDQPLPAAGALALDLPDGSDAAFVDCVLDLPADVPPRDLTRYVAIHAETVQQVHHAIGFNAAGQLDGVASVRIEMAIDGLPDLVVPTVVLSPDHPVDSTAVEVPVTSALTGLSTTLALTVTPQGGGPVVSSSLTHDFGDHPIMVITRDQLGPA